MTSEADELEAAIARLQQDHEDTAAMVGGNTGAQRDQGLLISAARRELTRLRSPSTQASAAVETLRKYIDDVDDSRSFVVSTSEAAAALDALVTELSRLANGVSEWRYLADGLIETSLVQTARIAALEAELASYQRAFGPLVVGAEPVKCFACQQRLESQLSARAPVAGELGSAIRECRELKVGIRAQLDIVIDAAERWAALEKAWVQPRELPDGMFIGVLADELGDPPIYEIDEMDERNRENGWADEQYEWTLSIARLPPPPTEPAREER